MIGPFDFGDYLEFIKSAFHSQRCEFSVDCENPALKLSDPNSFFNSLIVVC